MADRNRRHGLTRPQRRALGLLEAANQPGVLTIDATATYDGQPWINWQTAYALHDRGLVVVHPYGEAEAEVTLS